MLSRKVSSTFSSLNPFYPGGPDRLPGYQQIPIQAGMTQKNGMTRRNNIFLFALALATALLAGGCGKVDDDIDDEWKELLGDKPLRFRSAVSETKAASELTDGATFGVFAFLQEGDVENGVAAHWADGAGNGALWNSAFMFNQQVTKESGDYNYSPLRYWPSNEENTVSFWAYSPYNASATLYQTGTTNAYTRSSHGLPDMKFSVTNGLADFMTSNLQVDKTYWNCTNSDGVVDFEFGHRLAWVEFKAKTKEDYTTQTFTVTKVEIINACNDGVYHPVTDTWTDKALVSGVGRQAVAFSGSQVIVYSEARSCSSNPMLMIPQDMVRDASETGTVKARITYTQSEGGQNVSKTVEASLEVATIDEWEANHKYTYTFTISASDAIQLAIQVEKWEYWLGTSEYKENITVTKQLTWDPDTYVNGGTNCTRLEEFVLADDDPNDPTEYKVIVLKPGVNLSGKFIFDTPYNGTWYAMLEPVLGSQDGSIVFSNNEGLLEGIVGNEAEIVIRPRSESVSSTQYALLRFMCRTHPADEAHPELAQTIPVQDALIGGPFIIQQNIN